MKANLNQQEIDTIWEYAEPIPHIDASKKRLDCLGAIINKEEYNNFTSQYGWCVEYVLSPELLAHEGIPLQNMLCEANVRILHVDNYTLNRGHNIGEFARRVVKEGAVNKMCSPVWEVLYTKQEWIQKLQKIFDISDEKIKRMFPLV